MSLQLASLFNAANSLRQLSKKYTGSSDPHTDKQGRILLDMADNIMQQQFDQAAFRYNNLHVNVRSQISFQVLDLIGLSEEHVDD